jgi:hypothetical protein
MDLHFAPRVLRPMPPAEPPLLDAALRRAFDAASDVPVESGAVTWRFYRVRPEQAQAIAWLNARLIEPEVGMEAAQAAYDQWRSVPGWVVVTCLRGEGAEEEARLTERCLTAVQRVSLSLWSEAVRTSWITDLIVENEEFYRLVGIEPRHERAVGILWYGHAEKRE